MNRKRPHTAALNVEALEDRQLLSIAFQDTTLVVVGTNNADVNQSLVQSQRENLVFTAVSNVLKTRHDTTKNSISNNLR